MQNSAGESLRSRTGLLSEEPSYVMADIGEPADGGLSKLNDTTWVGLVYAVLHQLHVIRLFSALYHIWKDLSVVFKSYTCPCISHFLPGALLSRRGWFARFQVTILCYTCSFANAETSIHSGHKYSSDIFGN